jgi:hypothetical protein
MHEDNRDRQCLIEMVFRDHLHPARTGASEVVT